MRTKTLVISGAVILSLGALLLASAAYGGYKHDQQFKTKDGVNINQGKDGQTRSFTPEELTQAEQALSKGIKIDDPKNDWYPVPEGTKQPDGRPDNPHPYPLGWTDLKSVTVGADDKFIYFKFQYWDLFPKTGLVWNNDLLEGMGAKITSFTFVNEQGQNDSADLIMDVMYYDFEDRTKPAKSPTIGTSAMISPSGKDEQMETIFKVNSGVGMIYGGPGYDYLLGAFPLSLFNLKPGDTVIFDISTEGGSTKYHHEAIDFLLGRPNEKFGEKIKYVIGSGQYEILPNPDYSKHS